MAESTIARRDSTRSLRATERNLEDAARFLLLDGEQTEVFRRCLAGEPLARMLGDLTPGLPGSAQDLFGNLLFANNHAHLAGHERLSGCHAFSFRVRVVRVFRCDPGVQSAISEITPCTSYRPESSASMEGSDVFPAASLRPASEESGG